MKPRNLSLIITLTGISIVIYIIFITLFPNAPKKIIKIMDDNVKLTSEFHEIDPLFWYKEGDKLIFNNQTNKKQKVSLYTNELPSEKKKIGYVTSNVVVSGYLDQDCIVGFIIGEKNARDENLIFMGVNGKGKIEILNGNLKPLTEERISYGPNNLKQCKELNLSFYYYKNPYGWIIYFGAKGHDISNGACINEVPYEKLNSEQKQISLVVYNPNQKGAIWFKQWEIQNDWAPND